MHKQSLVWTFLSRLKKRIKYAGLNQYCPVCKGYIRRFFPHGNPPREHVKCPVCGSLERHRLDWLMFKKNTDLFDGKPKTMLARMMSCLDGLTNTIGDDEPSKFVVSCRRSKGLDRRDGHRPC